MSLRSFSKFIASLSLLACTSVFAAPLVVNVAGVQSYGEPGDSGNTVFTFNVGAGSTITSLAYDVNITAFNPSWLAEIGLYFGDSTQSTGVYFTPGFEFLNPGTGSFADSANLVDLGLDFQVGADGILYLEFFEDFDDSSVSPDGIWNFGTITFGITAIDVPPTDPGSDVPEPASTLLLGAGLAAMGYTGRRRARAKAAA
jgi:hypothetical protein